MSRMDAMRRNRPTSSKKSNCSATDADALNKYYLELSLKCVNEHHIIHKF